MREVLKTLASCIIASLRNHLDGQDNFVVLPVAGKV